MNLRFKIELIDSGEKSSLYTVRLIGEDKTEFEKFVSNPEVQKISEFNAFLVRIDEILKKYGCQERFFKTKESKITDAVAALWRDKIRLYCCRYPNIIIIAGSGGIKITKTYQEDPKLNECVQIMSEVSKRMDERIKNKDILIIGNKFHGNLDFSEA